MLLRRLGLVAAFLLVALNVASAASKKTAHAVGLQSFAAVQAPEAATQACYGATPKAAQDCAHAKCEKKAGKGGCFALTLCAPGGWAGIMGVEAGAVSFADVLCGAPTKEALILGFKAYCEGHLPQLVTCALSEVWSPDGTKTAVQQSWSPKDFGK